MNRLLLRLFFGCCIISSVSLALASDSSSLTFSKNRSTHDEIDMFSNLKNKALPTLEECTEAQYGKPIASKFLNCDLTLNETAFSNTPNENESKTNNFIIAPNCVEICFVSSNGLTKRCYSRCATGNNG